MHVASHPIAPQDVPERRPQRSLSRRLCVAPMMDWTDRHCRVFHRLLAPDALLYTEMITSAALIHGDRRHLLHFNAALERPVALQLGGSDPAELAIAARMGEDSGYDEINLNVGCPSDRVQSGRFGACLMREPERVAECVSAMQSAVSLPVTVKCRLGVDELDSWPWFLQFIDCVAGQGGCQVFIVHARKAWLSGLSPKENREVPPLQYDRVFDLKVQRPHLQVILNGGLANEQQCQRALQRCDGVMLGRAAYQTPWLLAELSESLFGRALPQREVVINALRDYVEDELSRGLALKHMVRHWLGLFQGVPGARQFRRRLSEQAHLSGADWTVVEHALDALAFEAERAAAAAAD